MASLHMKGRFHIFVISTFSLKYFKMRRLYTFLSSLTILFACCSALAQNSKGVSDAYQLLQEDITRAANLHHSYEAPSAVIDTPAPHGFKPFYVSHYGRHGSRYHTSMSPITAVTSIMDTLLTEGLLTEEGKAVRNDLKILEHEHEGISGYLTQKGAAEHRGISQRLYERCPQIFKQKDRRVVYAASTHVQRCIQSMANFCMQLKSNAPELECQLYAGDRFGSYLCNTSNTSATSPRTTFVADSVLNANFEPARIMEAWFTDPQRAASFFGSDTPSIFAFNVLRAGGIGQCLDIDDPDIYKHFTFDEIYALWKYDDVKTYNSMGPSVENNRIKDKIGVLILRDIIEKADEALAGGHKAADLRFGHDSGLAPLIALLRLEGFEKEQHMADVTDGLWYGFQGMPMGSNLQIIFYRNKKGDIIAKILRNEKETTIPAVPSYYGPYYKWSDLRTYFLSLVNG